MARIRINQIKPYPYSYPYQIEMQNQSTKHKSSIGLYIWNDQIKTHENFLSLTGKKIHAE